MVTKAPEGEHRKERMNEITKEEWDFIRSILHSAPKVMARVLQKHFNVMYSSKLLSRAKEKAQKELYGSRKDGLDRLIQFGERIKKEGGVFQVFHDSSLVITGIAYQTEDMVKMHKAYGDYVNQDGTFGTNVYELTLMPTVVVDAMGKSVISSINLAHSENNNDLLKMGNALGLYKENASYMTDGGTAFAVVAEATGMNHIECLHHFHNDLTKGQLGISHKERSNLTKNINKLLRKESENEYNDLLRVLREENKEHKQVLKYLEKIHKKRQKVCRWSTGKYFTAGGISSQRSESINAQIKERGDKSGVNNKINIFELCNHIQGKFDHHKAQSIKDIQQLMEEGLKWSKWVQTGWKSEAEKGPEYAVTIHNAETFTVEYKGGKTTGSKTRTVQIPNDGHPTCNCADFTSNLIPCRHIAAAYARSGHLEFFHIKNLAKRWHLKNHPWYQNALINMGLAEESPKEESNSGKNTDTTIEQEYLNLGIIPNAENIRYNNLNELFSRIVDLQKRDKHLYKLALLTMSRLVNQMEQTKRGSNANTTALRPPIQINSTKTKPSQPTNMSSLKLKAKANTSNTLKRRRCGNCGSTEHRADNSKCPRSENLQSNKTNQSKKTKCSMCPKSKRLCVECGSHVCHMCTLEILGDQDHLIPMSSGICSAECKDLHVEKTRDAWQ